MIGAAAAHELYRRNPEWAEGRLSEARSELVRGETLARVASRLALGDHLRMGRGGSLQRRSGSRPNVLASALEAVVGALFLDRGYPAAEALAVRLLEPEMPRLERPSASRNPKSALQEALQAAGAELPTYSIVDITGEDHSRQFTAEVCADGRVLGSGTGPRKSTAERRAAEGALAAMSELG